MSWIWNILLILGLLQLILIKLILCKSVQTRHQSSHRKLKNARIKAIKEEILTKLGMNEIPTVRNVTLSAGEEREKIKLFRKSLEETYGQIHELFPEEEYFAKKFSSFHQSGEYKLVLVYKSKSGINLIVKYEYFSN